MNMDVSPANEQAELWRGAAAARGWIEAEGLIEELFKPIERMLAETVAEQKAHAVLDVGCGTGGTTVAAARALAPGARAVGVDISEPMVAAARERAKREGVHADFVVADAETHAFQPASFDALISRFGVMFFADPLRAFTNLRRAAAPDAGLKFVAWRGMAENPFMTVAEESARPLMPDLPVRHDDEPGQFGLADADRVRRILEESGWGAVDIRAADFACAMPESALVQYLTKFGPVGRELTTTNADEATIERVLEAVQPAFDPYMHGDEVRFTAACWVIGARAG
jgi:ubiquinone/menaquinone biosynthesis C-methylase UbiE